MRTISRIALCFAALCAFSLAAAAETSWPERPVEFVVPAKPGGDTDINCRVFLKYLEKELGQSMVVVNIGGANVVGMNNVRLARPNGYRVLFFHFGALIAEIMGFADFSITRDFEVAGMPVLDKSNCFVAPAKAPYNDIKELVEYAKQHPGEVMYATETSSFSPLQILALEELAGCEFGKSDVGNAAEKLTAILGGRIDIIPSQYGLIKSYIESGDLKCLGIYSDRRLPGVDVPTFAECGYPLVFDKFFYLAFPKGTDRAIVDKLNAASKRVFDNPDYKKECEKNFVMANYFTPEESVKYIDDQMKHYRQYESALLGQ